MNCAKDVNNWTVVHCIQVITIVECNENDEVSDQADKRCQNSVSSHPVGLFWACRLSQVQVNRV